MTRTGAPRATDAAARPRKLRSYVRVKGAVASSPTMIDQHVRDLVARLAQKGWDVDVEPPGADAAAPVGPIFPVVLLMHRASRPADEAESEQEARAALYVALAELHLGNRSLDYVAEGVVSRVLGALIRRK